MPLTLGINCVSFTNSPFIKCIDCDFHSYGHRVYNMFQTVRQLLLHWIGRKSFTTNVQWRQSLPQRELEGCESWASSTGAPFSPWLMMLPQRHMSHISYCVRSEMCMCCHACRTYKVCISAVSVPIEKSRMCSIITCMIFAKDFDPCPPPPSPST